MTEHLTNDPVNRNSEGEPTENENTTSTIDIVKLCDKVVEDYRAGLVSKINALASIQAILKDHTRDDETDSALASLGSYLTVLDNYDRLQRAAADRGHGSGGTVDAGTGEHMDDGDPLDRTSTPSSIESGTRKRSRSLDSEDGDLGRHDGRRRINPNIFPWNIQEELSPSALAPDLRQTLVALENFSRDLKLAKSSLLNSARCPQFPDGEWTNLLAGRVVDLDHVLSGVYSIDSDSRKRERLGSLEVIVGGGNPLRTIRTHSDWVIAWDVFVQAVLYVFPHRSNELTAYGKFIRQLFTSVPVERHARVIQFDRAARLRAASRRDLLLSDHHQFTDLNVLWIQNAGGGVFGSDDRNRKGGGGAPRNGGRREACRRWNEGRCPNSTAVCNYAHICSKCRSTGHIVGSCTAAAGRK